ncbi:MAG: hypothetical protein WB810_08730 [Candidatus Cybelea sp.]
MARQIADGKARGRSTVLGIGVDEASGIVIDRHGAGKPHPKVRYTIVVSLG